MVSTSQKRTLDNDRIAQAIADIPNSNIVFDICDSADKLAKRLCASTTSSDSDFMADTSCAAITESFDYAGHLAEHNFKIRLAAMGIVPYSDPSQDTIWKEAGPCHV